MDIQMAEITAIVLDKVKVKFNQDDVPSALEYPKLSSYAPVLGDKVLMLKTNTSYICLGGVGGASKESAHIVGEYKFFAKYKGLMWNGWAWCNGRELSSVDYPELYAEIGTTFSANGKFLLPLASGRVLSDSAGKLLGSTVGYDEVTLTINQMPKHEHDLKVSNTDLTTGNWEYAKLGSNSGVQTVKKAVQASGSGQAHENRQPTLYGGYYYIYTGVM